VYLQKATGLILFNDGAYNADATLTDGATITWDVGSSPVAKVTLVEIELYLHLLIVLQDNLYLLQ
jgi:hypothetical protein